MCGGASLVSDEEELVLMTWQLRGGFHPLAGGIGLSRCGWRGQEGGTHGAVLCPESVRPPWGGALGMRTRHSLTPIPDSVGLTL